MATSKLLARKRPRLIPVRDSVVAGVLGMTNSTTWWRPWWEALSSDQRITDRLAAIRLDSDANVSLLRIADIVLWMKGRPADEAAVIELSDADFDGP